MNASELIISKPDELSKLKKIGDFTATMFFWALIFYLWQPIISLIAWSFGVKLFYEHMVVLGGSEELLLIIGVYAFWISIFGFLLIFWAKSNQWRFQNKSNRKSSPLVTSEMIASHYMIKDKVHEKIKGARNVSLWISDEFDITSRVNKIKETKPYLALESKDDIPDSKPDSDSGNILSSIK